MSSESAIRKMADKGYTASTLLRDAFDAVVDPPAGSWSVEIYIHFNGSSCFHGLSEERAFAMVPELHRLAIERGVPIAKVIINHVP